MNAHPDAHLSNSEIDRREQASADMTLLERHSRILADYTAMLALSIAAFGVSSDAVDPLEDLRADIEAAKDRFDALIEQIRSTQ